MRERNAPSKHGEYTHYTRGCRCGECRAANAAFCKKERKRRGKKYVRNCNLKQAHGISLVQYNELSTKQKHVCASCKKKETGKNQYGILPLAVDHDHDTDTIRGLLCMRCNRALGLLGDSIKVLKRLLEYRSRH